MNALDDFLQEEYPQALKLWENIVNIESWSCDHKGVNNLAAHLDTYFSALGLVTRKYEFDNAGSSLVAETTPKEDGTIALMAHMDTVHKPGAFGENKFVLDQQSILRGPGVHDCKGGIVTAVLVIKALKSLGYHKHQLRLILVGDEEVAHSECGEESLKVYEKEGKDVIAAFNFESAMPGEDIVIQRKGGAIVKVKVFGVPAHAGKAPQDGANAILAAARMIDKLESLTDYSTGVYYNCGKISGGTAVNIIPDYCEFEVGLRFPSNSDFQEAFKNIQEIAGNYEDKRIRAEVIRKATFKAMEKTAKTDKLLALYQESCRELGYGECKGTFVGGCSDASYMTMQNIPTLCAVGARGDNDHSPEEYAIASSIIDSAKKITNTILKIGDGF